MFVVVLAMLVCLLVSIGVALYVAFPGRGRPLPEVLGSLRPAARRGTSRRRLAARTRVDSRAQEARG